jgi:hypothetical protein
MHCKNCNYALWDLAVRQCPECGTPFKPSDFEFTLNAVRFCCPHCGQAYYGTGPKGHLVPRSFNCVSCGRAVDMDEMVLRPTEGVAEHQTNATAISWANKREKGWFKAFFITMGNAMGNPNRAIDAVPEGSSTWLAIAYMAIHAIPQLLLSGAIFFFFMFGVVLSTARGGPAFGLIVAVLGAIFAAPLLVVLWASLMHVLLLMTGPTKGWGRTMHAVCYSAGNNFISMIPCIGFYFCWAGMLWWSISAAFMLARGHGVRAWRAAVAAVVPVVLIIVLGAGGIAAMMYGVQRSMRVAATSMPGMPSMHATNAAAGQRVAGVLTLPGIPRTAHPAEMLLDHRISAAEMLLPGSASDTASCSVQGLTLNQLSYNFGGQGTERQTLATDPNLGGPACRVGDFVFTYGGMPDPAPDAELWLAIGWPDPALNKHDPAEVVIVKPRGMSEVVPTAQFAAALDEQNDLRKKHGLAALPHPRTVRATSKKVSSPYGGPRSTVTVSGGSGTGGGGTGPGMSGKVGGERFGGAADQDRVNTLAGALRGVNKPVGHIAELMGNESFDAYDFMDGSEFSGGGQIARMKRIKFGGTNLLAYSKLAPGKRREQEKLAADGLDAKTIAYRIGDVVFTHRGIDPAKVPYGSKQRELWVVIAWPEAMRESEADPDRRVYVGLADGSTKSFRLESFGDELDKQNALRDEFGLEPLPRPEDVGEDSPAVGSAEPAMRVGP